MTPIMILSEPVRSFFSLWAFTVLLSCIFSAILAAIQKRARIAVLSLLPFGCGYFLWQVLFDIHLFGNTEKANPISRSLGHLPWLTWSAALFLLTVFAVWIFIGVIRFGKRSLTPTAVKFCLDSMPCGVCCWRDNGRVLFSNEYMNRICFAVTGGPLMNGNQFYAAIKDGIVTVEGKVWRFSMRDRVFDGGNLHELIASDITAEYEKTKALKEDRAELSRLNDELREYNLGIDDTVRKQEILQAKVNIHDEMNRLMLSTVAAESEGTEAAENIFSLWEQNALLLCMEADGKTYENAFGHIKKLAEALKIGLVWNGDLPAVLSEKQRELFFSAAKEALANAAKHAGAKKMTVSFEQTESCVFCRFTNDGRIPEGEVRFTGGLSNLSTLAKKQGAELSAKGGDLFTLTLRFPKKSKNHPFG